MIKLGYAYTEWFTGRILYDYIDQYGRLWLATNKWSFYRLKNSLDTDKERKPLLPYGYY
jgi:hypothetical protein